MALYTPARTEKTKKKPRFSEDAEFRLFTEKKMLLLFLISPNGKAMEILRFYSISLSTLHRYKPATAKRPLPQNTTLLREISQQERNVFSYRQRRALIRDKRTRKTGKVATTQNLDLSSTIIRLNDTGCPRYNRGSCS